MTVVFRLLVPCFAAILCLGTPATEVFRDLPLAGGMNLSAVNSGAKPLEIGVILRGNTGARTEWRLAQWGTRFNLSGAPERSVPGGTRIVRNPGKKIAVMPGGLAGEGITLQVDGAAEFNGNVRKEGEAWPHLLLEQRIPKDFRIAGLTSLDFHVAFRVDHCSSANVTALDPALHTAQVTAYWTLHNRNAESPDHGEMIWFGLPLFDARHAIPQGHSAADAGSPFSSGKFIHTVEGSRFYNGPTGDGLWQELTCNLVPLIEEALASAQEQGFMSGTRVQDLHATSFNIGWEVTGPYDCAITLKGLSLDRVN